jgi:hypothetical protein
LSGVGDLRANWPLFVLPVTAVTGLLFSLPEEA